MFPRIWAIALNTYREAVRARLLLGVFACALATCGYAAVVGALSLNNDARVVADLGSASLSFFGVLIAIVLGSTSLHRELEYKTVFPILSRPLRRWEYLVGKYLGALLTVVVFILVQAAAILTMLALEGGDDDWKVGVAIGGMVALLGALLAGARRARVFIVIPWAAALALAAWFVAAPAAGERQVVCASAALAICEVGIVGAVATLFASFSSPFLTAAFTAMVFVIGRSAYMLGHLPEHLLGPTIVAIGRVLARIFPNLNAYVPARPLLLGVVEGHPVWPYVGWAALNAACYAAALLVVGSLAFQKRDFA
jgi:Cu-processing system permease protein